MTCADREDTGMIDARVEDIGAVVSAGGALPTCGPSAYGQTLSLAPFLSRAVRLEARRTVFEELVSLLRPEHPGELAVPNSQV